MPREVESDRGPLKYISGSHKPAGSCAILRSGLLLLPGETILSLAMPTPCLSVNTLQCWRHKRKVLLLFSFILYYYRYYANATGAHMIVTYSLPPCFNIGEDTDKITDV